MVELDYIVESGVLQRECQRPDILVDTDLKYDLVMPTRLRVGEIEVLELTEEEYQKHPYRDRLPSRAWDFIPILMIAAFVDAYFARLRDLGHCDIIFLDPDLRMTLQDGVVTVGYFNGDAPRGAATYEELYSVFAAFGKRVRQDFLMACPRLADHIELGVWFRSGAIPGSDLAFGH